MGKIEAFHKEFCWGLLWRTILGFGCSKHPISESLQDTALSFGDTFDHLLKRLESLSVKNPGFRASPRKTQKNTFEFCIYVCLFIYFYKNTYFSFGQPYASVIHSATLWYQDPQIFPLFVPFSSRMTTMCLPMHLDLHPAMSSPACWKGKGKYLFGTWKRGALSEVVKAYLTICNLLF